MRYSSDFLADSLKRTEYWRPFSIVSVIYQTNASGYRMADAEQTPGLQLLTQPLAPCKKASMKKHPDSILKTAQILCQTPFFFLKKVINLKKKIKKSKLENNVPFKPAISKPPICRSPTQF